MMFLAQFSDWVQAKKPVAYGTFSAFLAFLAKVC
jgi:hypothetical protein